MNAKELAGKVREGGQITREEAIELYGQPLDELCDYANQIRRHFCGERFDLCTIINGKSGRCPENCRFCAQSVHNHTCAAEYPMLPAGDILAQAKRNYEQGALRYSIVTSGRRLSDAEVEEMCRVVRRIKEEAGIFVCVSFGLLTERKFRRLKEAAAQAAGLSVCSGGIMGLGETPEDRIDMALSLRELGIRSVPVNMLNPIPGTPFEHNKTLTNEDMRRITAVYRFILPDASIRLAGGRGLLPDQGRGCFLSGANAAITGDMLTTAGITIGTDRKLLKELGYEAGLRNE